MKVLDEMELKLSGELIFQLSRELKLKLSGGMNLKLSRELNFQFAGELNEDEFVRGCLRDDSLASLLNGSAQ